MASLARKTKVRLIDKDALPIRPVEPVRKPDAWFRSEKHLAWLRTLPPLDAGGEGPIEVDHLRIGTDACAGEKASDFFGLPLTAYGHRRRHSIGEATFYASIGVHDRIGAAIALALVSPCERARKAASAYQQGKRWQEAF